MGGKNGFVAISSEVPNHYRNSTRYLDTFSISTHRPAVNEQDLDIVNT